VSLQSVSNNYMIYIYYYSIILKYTIKQDIHVILLWSAHFVPTISTKWLYCRIRWNGIYYSALSVAVNDEIA